MRNPRLIGMIIAGLALALILFIAVSLTGRGSDQTPNGVSVTAAA